MQDNRTAIKKAKEGIVKTTPNYRDTLIAIPVGQARQFKAQAKLVGGMRRAACRLHKARMGLWEIKLVDNDILLVTRNA